MKKTTVEFRTVEEAADHMREALSAPELAQYVQQLGGVEAVLEKMLPGIRRTIDGIDQLEAQFAELEKTVAKFKAKSASGLPEIRQQAKAFAEAGTATEAHAEKTLLLVKAQELFANMTNKVVDELEAMELAQAAANAAVEEGIWSYEEGEKRVRLFAAALPLGETKLMIEQTREQIELVGKSGREQFILNEAIRAYRSQLAGRFRRVQARQGRTLRCESGDTAHTGVAELVRQLPRQRARGVCRYGFGHGAVVLERLQVDQADVPAVASDMIFMALRNRIVMQFDGQLSGNALGADGSGGIFGTLLGGLGRMFGGGGGAGGGFISRLFGGGGGGGAGFLGGLRSLFSGGGGFMNAVRGLFGFGAAGASSVAGAAGATGSMLGAASTTANTGVGAALAGGGGAMTSSMMVPIIGWVVAAMMSNDMLWKKGWRIGSQQLKLPNGRTIMGNGRTSRLGELATLGAVTGLHRGLSRLGLSDRWASLISGSAVHARLWGRKRPELRGAEAIVPVRF